MSASCSSSRRRVVCRYGESGPDSCNPIARWTGSKRCQERHRTSDTKQISAGIGMGHGGRDSNRAAGTAVQLGAELEDWMRLAHHARTARRPLAYFAILVLAGVTALV